jgi:hypothetical protein
MWWPDISAKEERGKGRHQPGGQGDRPEHHCLSGEDSAAARQRGKRGADHPGRVLRADRERAEHDDDQLADVQAGQALLSRAEARPEFAGSRGGGRAGQRADPYRQRDQREQGPVRGPHGPDLGELRAQRARQPCPARLRREGGRAS